MSSVEDARGDADATARRANALAQHEINLPEALLVAVMALRQELRALSLTLEQLSREQSA